jgi:hypothetical protein
MVEEPRVFPILQLETLSREKIGVKVMFYKPDSKTVLALLSVAKR